MPTLPDTGVDVLPVVRIGIFLSRRNEALLQETAFVHGQGVCEVVQHHIVRQLRDGDVALSPSAELILAGTAAVLVAEIQMGMDPRESSK